MRYSTKDWAAVLLYLAGASLTHAEDCALKRLASVELAEASDGSMLVPVTLANTAAYLVLSTAAPLSALQSAFAAEHKLSTGTEVDSFQIINGQRIPAQYAVVDQFSLDHIQFRSSRVRIYPMSKIESQHAGTPIAGYLGWDVLSRYDVELDLGHHRLSLYSPQHCPKQVVYWASAYDSTPLYKGGMGEPYFAMELDGHQLETSLGTDRATTSLRTDVSKKLYKFDEKSSDVYKAADAGEEPTLYYRAMAINSRGLSVINAKINLVVIKDSSCDVTTKAHVTGYTGCFGPHPLTLGRNVLAKLRIYLATQEGVMYFTAADAVQTASTH
jgi:hypothetical protein